MSALYKNVWSVEIYDKGIKIKERFHDWGKIKSISFQTGRLVHDYSFFEGPRLPALQKIYLLDMEGKEFSCVIDIDYFLKENRNKNNLVIIKESLFDCGKGQIISDWAEKR